MVRIEIIAEKCTECTACVFSCPERILQQSGSEGVPVVFHEDMCIACGHCVAICPQGAIVHSLIPAGKLSPVSAEILPAAASLMEVLKKRRTYRAFLNKDVEREKIERVIEAAQTAPSAHNTQSTEYIVVTGKDLLTEMLSATVKYYVNLLKRMGSPLARFFLGRFGSPDFRNAVRDMEEVVEFYRNGRDVIIYDVPCLIILHAKKSFRFPGINAQLALQNASLMAEALGLGSFIAGYAFVACKRDKKISTLVGIPRGHKVHGILGLGYPRFSFTQKIGRKTPIVKWL